MSKSIAVPVLLVPGAWMGGWIWEDTVERLRKIGRDAHTLTLPGCGPDIDPDDAAQVTLADHVAAVVDRVEAIGSDRLVLVGHSYSGVVVGQASDRLGPKVVRSIHVGSFLRVTVVRSSTTGATTSRREQMRNSR